MSPTSATTMRRTRPGRFSRSMRRPYALRTAARLRRPSGSRAQAREAIARRSTFAARDQQRFAKGGRGGGPISARLVALAERDEQVDMPSAQEAPGLLDVFAVPVERAVVQEVAADQLACFLEQSKGFIGVTSRAASGNEVFEGRDVAPGNKRRIETIPIVAERDHVRRLTPRS